MIAKKGNLCLYCGKNKQQSQQLVEAREDRFISLSIKWLLVALLLAAAPWIVFGSPIAFCGEGVLLFFPGLVFSHFWTGMAGG